MRSNTNRSVQLLWVCILSALWLFPLCRPALAQNQANIFIVPAPLSLYVGQTASISVWIQNAANVFSYNLQMSFDPSKVQVLDADPSLPGVQVRKGNFLFPPQTQSTLNIVDNTVGRINFNNSLLDPASSISGDGILLSFELQAIGSGTSTLGFYQIDLISPGGVYLPLTVAPAQIFTSPAPLPTTPASPPTPTPSLTPAPTSTIQAVLPATETLVEGIATEAPLVSGTPGIYLQVIVQELENRELALTFTQAPAAMEASTPTPLPPTPSPSPSETALLPPTQPSPGPPPAQMDWSQVFSWGAVILALGWLVVLAVYLIYRFGFKKPGGQS